MQAFGGGAPGDETFEEVLVIGAGSGTDVSRALQFGVGHVDAVDIDPVIQRLGRRDHPAQPYSDPRVTVYNDDGRNFLRASEKKYASMRVGFQHVGYIALGFYGLAMLAGHLADRTRAEAPALESVGAARR